jgi:hypothetical protein
MTIVSRFQFLGASRRDTKLIWFSPLDPIYRPEVGYGGSPEYMKLFGFDSPWKRASHHVHVFKIYPQWILHATDNELQIQFADLKRRGIELALEFGVLSESSLCGSGVEGFGGGGVLEAARRIRRNGGELRYLAMDEPCFFGTIFSGTNACRWSPDQMAENAARNIRALQAEFPDVIVGEIEPIPACFPDWASRYKEGILAFGRALGFLPAFFHADVNWMSNTFRSDLPELHAMLLSLRIPLGVIYDGNMSDISDATWLRSASEHLDEVEFSGIVPQDVVFQSWDAFPRRLLPEEHSDSFTYFIDSYFRDKTSITAHSIGCLLRGTIGTTDGFPLDDAPISVSVRPISSVRILSTYSYEGPIPAGADTIVFGARVNLESCQSGEAEFVLESFQYISDSNLSLTQGFSHQLNGWNVWVTGFPPPEVKVEHDHLVAIVRSRQGLVLNSFPVCVRGVGSYRFAVRAWVSSESVGHGYFALIFQKSGREFERIELPLRPATIPIQTIRSNRAGKWQLLSRRLKRNSPSIEVAYPGSQKYRPSQATLNLPLASIRFASPAQVVDETILSESEVLVLMAEALEDCHGARVQAQKVVARARVLFPGIPTVLIFPDLAGFPIDIPSSIASYDRVPRFSIERGGVLPWRPRFTTLLSMPSSTGRVVVGITSSGNLHGPQNPARPGDSIRLFAATHTFAEATTLASLLASPASFSNLSIAGAIATIDRINELEGDIRGLIEIHTRVPQDAAGSGQVHILLHTLAPTSTGPLLFFLANDND